MVGSLQQDPSMVYKKTLRVTIDDQPYRGTGVYPLSETQKITISPVITPQVIRITSCHREIFLENPKVPYRFHYDPTDIESSPACPLEIGVYSIKKGVEYGYIDFITKENLPATIHCNGEIDIAGGVSICQAKKGLVQKISFSDPVRYKTNCLIMIEKNNTFEYQAPKGICQAIFTDSQGLLHRHIVYGYEDILIREN